MITLATLPKPFIGHIGVIQRNAIQSWLQLKPRPTVILFGDEEGTRAFAEEVGAVHMPQVETNRFGTPLMSSVYEQFEDCASTDVLCYSNADILLFQDCVEAVQRAHQRFSKFALIGECMNLDLKTPIDFQYPHWEAIVRSDMRARGKPRGRNATDFFFFTRGHARGAPPITLGRAYFDSWLLWKARSEGMPLIDASPCITAIHQNHYYTAVPGETFGKHSGIEATENLTALGGRSRVYYFAESTHRMTPTGFRRLIAGTLLFRKRWEYAKRRILWAGAWLWRPLKRMTTKR